MYKTAIFLVNHFWGKPADMADGMGVLLLTWNQAFYRYGTFDFDKLERVIEVNFTAIEGFHGRDILTLKTSDESVIKELFEEFLEALQIADGKMKGRKSPVAVSKALHLLAPAFFTLWDDRIARAYDSYYKPHPCDKYLSFSYKMQNLAQHIGLHASSGGKTLLKLIDEYNYAKHTKGWI